MALFRIGLAITILYDLFDRAFSLAAFHADSGLFTRSLVLQRLLNPAEWSVYLVNGTVLFQALLFLVAAIFALMLLFGYKTRFSTIISFILLLSLQHRNPLVLYGGDLEIRVLMFWAMFLPLGAKYGIDTMRERFRADSPTEHFSMASIALVIQVALIYLTAVWGKTGSDGVIFWQLFGAIILFSPVFRTPFRFLAIVGFILMQLGFGLSMMLGFFPFVSIVALFPFFPDWFWEKINRCFRSKERLGLKIYYDHDCGFCERTVFFLKTFLMIPETKVLPAQSSEEIYSAMIHHNSWVIVDLKGKHYYHWKGVQKVLSLCPLLWPLGKLLGIKPVAKLGTKLYTWIACHRGQACVRPTVQPPPASVERLPRLANIAAAFFLAVVLLWNLSNHLRNFSLPGLDPVGRAFGLDQNWNMFSPSPLKDDGWYVIPGKLADGSEVNVLDGGPVNFTKPENVYLTYKTQRWYKLLTNLWLQDYTDLRLNYGQYLCREWNWSGEHPSSKRLETFDLDFMKESSLPDGQEAPLEKQTLWSHRC